MGVFSWVIFFLFCCVYTAVRVFVTLIMYVVADIISVYRRGHRKLDNVCPVILYTIRNKICFSQSINENWFTVLNKESNYPMTTWIWARTNKERGFHDICGKKGNVLFNDALNTFYLRLYGVRHMVKDHSESEKGNPLPPHGILFPISSKGSFICMGWVVGSILHGGPIELFLVPASATWLV